MPRNCGAGGHASESSRNVTREGRAVGACGSAPAAVGKAGQPAVTPAAMHWALGCAGSRPCSGCIQHGVGTEDGSQPALSRAHPLWLSIARVALGPCGGCRVWDQQGWNGGRSMGPSGSCQQCYSRSRVSSQPCGAVAPVSIRCLQRHQGLGQSSLPQPESAGKCGAGLPPQPLPSRGAQCPSHSLRAAGGTWPCAGPGLTRSSCSTMCQLLAGTWREGDSLCCPCPSQCPVT